MKTVSVLAVASEIFPLVKTGGLADVTGALPEALARENVHVRTLVPGYPTVIDAVSPAHVHELPSLFGSSARVIAGTAKNLDLLVLDAPHLFGRHGGPYADPSGRDWADNAQRFATLGRAAAAIATGALSGYAPDLVHGHDWQAALTFAYLRYADVAHRPGTVMTIHNLAFQGQFAADLFPQLELPHEAFSMEGIEYHGTVSYLKAGLQYADRITTVSPTYASDIGTSEAGMGLDGVIRARGSALHGITNGVDVEAWNPETDPWLAANFSTGNIGPRTLNKTDLQSRFGLDQDGSAPLFGVVSRLTWQKGLDLLLDCIPTLLEEGAQLVVLGTGDWALENGFYHAAVSHPGRVGCVIGYDEAMAHRIQAGSDALLVPSRFEPCGLTQLCAMRYGAVPVVARVGGLSDSVIDANAAALARKVATGVQFTPVTHEMLRVAIERTVALYRQPSVWKRTQANGMAFDVSWQEPARQYAALYRELLAHRR